MTFRTIALTIILSLTLLTFCCPSFATGHMHTLAKSGDHLIHYALLVTSAPVSLFVAFFVIVVLFILFLFNTSPATPFAHLVASQSSFPPDGLWRHPLLSLFSDGILNPKPY